MQGIESKEAILVELLNDHIDGLNNGLESNFSFKKKSSIKRNIEEIASLPPEDRTEMRSLLSIDRLLRMVASADKMMGYSPSD